MEYIDPWSSQLLKCAGKVRANNKLSITDSEGVVHRTSLFSRTHDMGCYSWSIPAGHSCPSAVYGEGTICGSCYAMINRYGFDNVADAQWLRFVWTRQLLKTNPALWVATMVKKFVAYHKDTLEPAAWWGDWEEFGGLAEIEAAFNSDLELLCETPT